MMVPMHKGLAMRVKKFGAQVDVSVEFMRLQRDDAISYARSVTAMKLDGILTGPRGGRYLMFGPLTERGWGSEDYWSRTYPYVVTRMGKYLRPRKS